MLLHCFNCDAFNPQEGDALQCSQCRSDFVEIVQIERSPTVPGNRPSNTAHNAGDEQSNTDGGAAPGFQGLLGSLLSSILPSAMTQPNSEEARETHQARTGAETDEAAARYTEQPQPPPFNDFFSQMFGQFPQGRAAPSPLGDSTYSRTTHGPGGSSFTFTFGSSSGGPAFVGSRSAPAPDGGRSQPLFNDPSGVPPGQAGHFGQQIPQIQSFPDLASFLAQALGAVPGRAGDYAHGETFDNIITELMNRNSDTNVHAATERAISQIRRIHLQKEGSGLETEKIGEECSICQDEYVEKDILTELKCRHVYHEECLLNWLKTNGICPICRAPVTESEPVTEQDALD